MDKRAVLYARVCVDDGRKLAEQLQVCRQYAEQHHWHIVAALAEQGASTTSSNLPQLNRILEMAQTAEFDVLIVRDAYRLSRSLARLLVIEESLARQGIQLEYVLHSGSATFVSNLVKGITTGPSMAMVRGRRRTW